MKKIYLFDFDWVIVDTLPIAVKTYNKLMIEYWIDKQFSEQEFASIFTTNFHEWLKKFIPDDKVRNEIVFERWAEYIKNVAEFRVFPWIIDALNNLNKVWKIIIISSNATEFIKIWLNSQNIDFIDEVLWWDVEKSKVVKINWQKDKYSESDIYYIWDTSWDIIEWKKAWVKTVWVTWWFHNRELLEEQNPDYLFDNASEFEKIM